MKKVRKVFMTILALGTLVLLSSYLTAVNVRIAKIQSFKGNVQVQRAQTDSWINAEQDMRLYEGDVIKTGGRSKAVIELDDGSISQITSLSTMKIDQLAKSLNGKSTNMDIDVGKSWMKVKKMNHKADKFNVSTPTAVAGVRGTYFSTEVEQTTDSTFDVFEGEISVEQRYDPTTKVFVRTNHRSKVKSGASSPTSPSAIPQNELNQALSEGIDGGLDSQNMSYDLQISIDPPVVSAGGKAVVSVQFVENGKPYNGSVMFILSLGGSATFVENNSQSLEIISNEKGFSVVEITDNIEEQIDINADVSFEVQQ